MQVKYVTQVILLDNHTMALLQIILNVLHK